MSTGPGRNLYQRLQTVAQNVGVVNPTGQTRERTPALSIEDVENAIRPLLSQEGIVTRWSNTSLERFAEKTKSGEMTMWQGAYRVTVVNADSPEDQFTDEFSDIGNSPAAARSFAVKGFYKSLFHLTDEGDRLPLPAREETASAVSAAPANGRAKPDISLVGAAQEREDNPPAKTWKDRANQAINRLADESGKPVDELLGMAKRELRITLATAKWGDEQYQAIVAWVGQQTGTPVEPAAGVTEF